MIYVLDEPLRTTIETLLRRGVGQRQIHRLTQVDRKTIRRYARRLAPESIRRGVRSQHVCHTTEDGA
jgi:hypothetical protein